MSEKRFVISSTLKKDRWGDLTVESARDVLNELVELGYGEFELLIGYDSNLVYTSFTNKVYVDEEDRQVVVKE